jgi:hypothetical protein
MSLWSRVLQSRRRVLFLLLAAALSPRASSAHVLSMSVPELAAASPHIVVATVEGRRSRWNGPRDFIVTDYTLRIEDRLRGQSPGRVVITVPGGTLGNLSDETCLSVHLEPGSRYLLFLGEPGGRSLTPVIGAAQGMYREDGEGYAARGEGTAPVLLKGKPVRFRDLVGAMRKIVAETPLAPPSLSKSDPRLPAFPAKTWDPSAPVRATGSAPPLAAPGTWAVPALPADAPAAVEVAGGVPLSPPRRALEKFVYADLANLPIVVNPLPSSSSFSPGDQYAMSYWNRYGGDLYRVADPPSPTWAYGNGVFDIAGFPDGLTLARQFGFDWSEFGQGVLAFTSRRTRDGVTIEADVVFNPNKQWTLDDNEGMLRGKPYPFKDVALHELGHVWGLDHPWETQNVWWDSVMNYKPKHYYVVELFADDTAALRDAHPPGAPLRDGLISSYITDHDGTFNDAAYIPAEPSVSSVKAGGAFSLTSPIKIENVGTVPLVNPAVEVYLTPGPLSFDGAVLLKRAKVKGKVPSGGTLKVNPGALKVPKNAPVGTYYLAFLLRDPKDAYQGNNGAWSSEDVTLEVTRR